VEPFGDSVCEYTAMAPLAAPSRVRLYFAKCESNEKKGELFYSQLEVRGEIQEDSNF